MPARRPHKPSVPAQPTPTRYRPTRRHRRRNNRHALLTSSPSSSLTAATVNKVTEATKCFGLLDLPDDVLHVIFLFVINAPDHSATLRDKSLYNWEYAIWIGNAHPKLYRVLKNTVRSVSIHSTDIVTPDEIAVTLPSLQHLTLDSHSLASQFVHAFGSLCFASSLQSLHLENVDVPHKPFVQLVNSTQRLSSLTLSFITLRNIPEVFAAAVNALGSLRILRLHGLSGLTANCVASVCSASSGTLHALSLRYLRHQTINNELFIKQIASTCALLTAIDLEHLIHVSAHDMHSFLQLFAPQLHQIRLADVPMSQRQIQDILIRAGTLSELTISNVSIVDPEALSLIIGQRAVGRLKSLDIRGIYALSDVDIAVMMTFSFPMQLYALTLRNSPLLGEGMCSTVSVCIGDSLRTLDLRGCVICDAGLHALASQCRCLADVAFGSDGTQVPWHDAPLFRTERLSNNGFDQLLDACGQTLRHFFWETPRAVVPGDGPIRFEPMGIVNLHAGRLAQSLARKCKRLIRVEVNWLRPPLSNVVERAACDLSFFELDQRHEHVSVFLDKDPL